MYTKKGPAGYRKSNERDYGNYGRGNNRNNDGKGTG